MEVLRLNVKRTAWRSSDPHSAEADQAFAEVREEVHARDGSRCRFCGFTHYGARPRGAPLLLQVHHRDDDHHNNTPANLITVDSLCHAYHHIGFAGAFHDARLMIMPELSPAVVNIVHRAMWAARYCYVQSENDETKREAMEPLLQLANRWEEVVTHRIAELETQLGAGTSQPAVVGSMMLRFGDRELNEFNSLLDTCGVRLAHQATSFVAETEHAVAPGGVFSTLHPTSWAQIVEPRVATLWRSR